MNRQQRRTDKSRARKAPVNPVTAIHEAGHAVFAVLFKPATDPTVELTFPMPDPISDPATVASAGYGSPEAIEAAYDAHVIWSRATAPMRLTIEGLMDGKSQLDIASELKMDRFKVARMMKNFQRQFAVAA